MKKWLSLSKSILLSLFIYMWFLGSSLLISIDDKSRGEVIDNLFHLEIENEMRNWTLQVSDLCEINCLKQKYNKNKKKENETERKLLEARKEKIVRDNLIYIPELQQLWCLTPKAASTSWSHKIIESLNNKYNRLQRGLLNATIPIQVILRKYYGNIGTKAYKEIIASPKAKKILLTRHPFTRLISAYEDKLRNRKARNDSMYFFSHYGVKINRAFRKNRRLNKKKEPTFEEFIDYLLETDPIDYDEHWKPISLLCGVCNIPYNHIIRQEELNKVPKMKFHLMKLDLEDNFQRKNTTPRLHENVGEYFRNISPEKMKKLIEKYKDDFNLFGYQRKWTE